MKYYLLGVLLEPLWEFSENLAAAAAQKPEQNGIIFYVCLGHLMCLHFCGLPYSRHPYQLADFNDTCWWSFILFNALAFFAAGRHCGRAVEMTGNVIINELHFHSIVGTVGEFSEKKVELKDDFGKVFFNGFLLNYYFWGWLEFYGQKRSQKSKLTTFNKYCYDFKQLSKFFKYFKYFEYLNSSLSP